MDGKPSGFKGNEVYGKMLGEDGWIQRIRNADLSDEDDVNAIGSLPLELVPEGGEIDELYPWEPKHPEWGSLNVGGTLSSKQIRHLLFSVERSLEPGNETNQHPQMPRIHDIGSKPQVEHIIPKAPRILGGKWYEDDSPTQLHREYVYALGNHCLLEDSKNSAARNKIPTEKADVYVGSDFKSTFEVGNSINVSGTWGVKEIKRNAEKMMSALVKFYGID